MWRHLPFLAIFRRAVADRDTYHRSGAAAGASYDIAVDHEGSDRRCRMFGLLLYRAGMVLEKNDGPKGCVHKYNLN
jgi:hypothetical protein